MAPPLPERLSRQPPPCNDENIGAADVNATPSFASASGPAAGSQDKQTPHITLRSPQSSTDVLSSPPSTGLTSQHLLPEVISSADPSSGARPSMQIAVREANLDETTHSSHRRHLGEASEPPPEPMSWRPASPRVAAASRGGGTEAAIIEADNSWPLRPASDVSAVTGLCDLPNEVLLQILRYLDVCDLLCTSRVSKDLLLPLCLCRTGNSTPVLSLSCISGPQFATRVGERKIQAHCPPYWSLVISHCS